MRPPIIRVEAGYKMDFEQSNSGQVMRVSIYEDRHQGIPPQLVALRKGFHEIFFEGDYLGYLSVREDSAGFRGIDIEKKTFNFEIEDDYIGRVEMIDPKDQLICGVIYFGAVLEITEEYSR